MTPSATKVVYHTSSTYMLYFTIRDKFPFVSTISFNAKNPLLFHSSHILALFYPLFHIDL